MIETRSRRWRNSVSLGGPFFVTTTTLERANRFQTPEQKDLVTRSLIQSSLALKVQLTHFVVLSNHLHLLVTLPESMTISDYVRRLKVDTHARFGQTGPLWERSFRSVRVLGSQSRALKIGYIHANPLKYGLVERAEDYRWSSAFALDQGCLLDDFSLNLRASLNLYAS